MPVEPITDTARLAEFCTGISGADYITIDTEFMRENTYWPILCLVQVAGPKGAAAAIDAQAEGIDLAPLYEILADESITKVFHAARQDLEIFYHRMGSVPAPVFDSQLAAMVCGLGDQISYENLLARTIGVTIDKSSRFTDWSRRPLTPKQLDYAMADVIHLRPVYRKLANKLEASGRAHWLDEEMAVLTSPDTYRMDPRDAWRRVKSRGGGKRAHGILVELAAWREREARTRDIPRNRMLRDEAISEIAAHAPRTPESLARTRGLSQKAAEGKLGAGILKAVEDGIARPEDSLPERPERPGRLPPGLGPLTDLLKVLLKLNCEKHNVAPRLIASGGDLERIAADDGAEVRALGGWRREIFGADALALKAGKIALAADGKKIRVMTLD